MKSIYAFLVAILLASNADAASTPQDLKVGVLHFPPFYVVSETEKVGGIYTDILRKVLAKAGYTYSIDGFPPKRFYIQLGNNTTNFFLGVRGSKYIEGKVEFGTLEFEGIQLRIYTTDQKKVITKKEDLVGKRVIVIRAFGYGGLAKFLQDPKNKVDVIETSDHFTAFKMLAAGRGEYLLDYRATSSLVMDTLKLKNIHYGVLMQAPTYFIVNKQYPNYQDVLSRVEKAYLDLVKAGEIDDIRAVAQ